MSRADRGRTPTDVGAPRGAPNDATAPRLEAAYRAAPGAGEVARSPDRAALPRRGGWLDRREDTLLRVSVLGILVGVMSEIWDLYAGTWLLPLRLALPVFLAGSILAMSIRRRSPLVPSAGPAPARGSFVPLQTTGAAALQLVLTLALPWRSSTLQALALGAAALALSCAFVAAIRVACAPTPRS